MRVSGVFKPSDYPGSPDAGTQKDIADLFDYLCPGSENPEINQSHAGVAITAQNPTMALNMAKLSRFLALETSWCQRPDLRELAIQTLNLHFKSDFSFQARLPNAQAAGISSELLAALPYWRTTRLFNEEQRLVIEYTNAVVSGDVPAELFGRVVERFGEKQAIEFTTVVAFWSSWAMIINAVRPEFDSGS